VIIYNIIIIKYGRIDERRLIYRIMEGFMIYKIGDVVEGRIIDFTHEGNGY